MLNNIGKVLCGDAKHFLGEFPDESVDLFLVDPPYGVSFKSNMAAEGYEKDPIANDGLEEWKSKLPGWVKGMYRALKPGGALAMFTAGGCRISALPYAWTTTEDIFKEVNNVLVWDRCDMGMGWKFRPQWESIIIAFKGMDPKTWNGTGKETNILRCPRIIPKSGEHPTPKPIPLLGDIIELLTNEGDLVVDAFCGGGSTLEAAQILKRKWIGNDIEPKYVRMSTERMDVFKTQPQLF